LQSKSGQPLTRYFPELVAGIAALTADRFVLDGEIVVPEGRGFSFDALLQRIHPAASRIAKLAEDTPARLIVFDLLLDSDGTLLTGETLPVRRRRVEAFGRKHLRRQAVVRLSPTTRRRAAAAQWAEQARPALRRVR